MLFGRKFQIERTFAASAADAVEQAHDSSESENTENQAGNRIQADPALILEVKNLPLRNLAHLGDAVFELYERERELTSAPSVNKMHNKVVARVNSKQQAQLLENLKPLLSEAELDIVRRARNLKSAGRRNVEQAILRQATAFEALIGYLYLTDEKRLEQLLGLTNQ